ncbi:hypothetical protein DFS33DRAFT_1277941 [Desarmillaria ectypa]|nr:hypothetical protein DFS33DRAFT_1277941 [Desarmillaria ectypa]
MSSDPSVPNTRAVAENIDMENLVFGRTLVPVVDQNKVCCIEQWTRIEEGRVARERDEMGTARAHCSNEIECAQDSHNEDNKKRCVDSVQASADEIYKAYQTKQAPLPADYQAWTHAPTLESVNAHQTLVMLFTFKSERRKEIENRRLWTFKTDWWFATTAAECKASSWWNYPITINGLQNTFPGALEPSLLRECGTFTCSTRGPAAVYFTSGGLSSDLIFNVMLFTPLAAINFDDGKEISVRVYYLDKQYFLQEYCYSADKGKWLPGELESASGAINEFCNDGYWFRGATLPVALSGPSLAAVAYSWNGLQPRVYDQTDDLSINDHCLNDNSGWFPDAVYSKPEFARLYLPQGQCLFTEIAFKIQRRWCYFNACLSYYDVPSADPSPYRMPAPPSLSIRAPMLLQRVKLLYHTSLSLPQRIRQEFLVLSVTAVGISCLSVLDNVGEGEAEIREEADNLEDNLDAKGGRLCRHQQKKYASYCKTHRLRLRVVVHVGEGITLLDNLVQ